MGLFSKGGSAPQPPDPYDTADAQTQMNIQTALANARMNRTNQTTPWGSINWTEGPVDANGVPTYSSNVTLSPEQQRLLDAQQNQQLTRGGMAADLLRQMQGTAATRGLDFSSLPALHGFPELTAMHQQGGAQGGQTPQIAGIPGAAAGGMGLQQTQGTPQAPAPQGAPNVNKPGTLMPSAGSATQGDPISGMGADAGAQGAAPQGRISVDPESGRLMLDGQLMDRQDPRMYGQAGQYLENQNASFNRDGGFDPRYYAPTQVSTGDGSFETRYTLRPDVQERMGGMTQLAQSGVGGGGDDGYHEVIDPSQIQWNEEFGMLTSPDNIRGQDPTERRQNITRAVAVMAPFAGAAAMHAMGAGAGAGAGSVGGATPASSAGGLTIPGDMAATLTPAANPAMTAAPNMGGGMWETFTNYMRNNPRNAGSSISALLSMGGGGGGGSTQAAPRTSSGSRQAIVRRPTGKAGDLAKLLRGA